MGMNYNLVCEDDKMKSSEVEFSIVGYYHLKHLDVAEKWVKFLAEHSGHKIHLVDGRGNETKPDEITGRYVLGIDDE